MKKFQLRNLIRRVIKEQNTNNGHSALYLTNCQCQPSNPNNQLAINYCNNIQANIGTPTSIGFANGGFQCNGQACTQADIGQVFDRVNYGFN